MRQKRLFKWLGVTVLFLLAACSDRLHTGDIPSEDVLSDTSLSTQADALVWKRVAVSTDDAEEVVSTGSVTLNSIDLDFGSNASGSTAVGTRFTGISIPKGAQIQSAYLYFLPKEATSGTTTLQIAAQASDNAGTFTNTARNVTSRTRTANISWSVPAWSAPTTLDDPAVRSPNLASVVQTVVNRSGWLENNALAFIIQGSGERIAHSFDGEAGNKPALEISYTIPNPPRPSCLDSSTTLLTPSGDYTTTYKVAGMPKYTGVNAKNARFLAKQVNGDTPLNIGKNSLEGYICVSGGFYDSGLSDAAFWDCDYIVVKNSDGTTNTTATNNARATCRSNGQFHGNGGNGIKVGYYPPDQAAYEIPNVTVEGIAVDVTGDGIAFKDGTNNWKFRNSYIRHAGDDAVESDFFNNGFVDNILVDWAYTGFSCRRGSKSVDRAVTMTIQNSLLALKRQEGTASESNPNVYANDPNHNELFKWNRNAKTGPATTGCKLTLKNNVFLLTTSAADYIYPEDDPEVTWDAFNEAACQNNTIIYLGSNTTYKDYIKSLETRFPNCFSVKFADTGGLNLWKSKRANWFDNNPEFEYYRTREPAGATIN